MVNMKRDSNSRYEMHVVRRLCTPPCGAKPRGVASTRARVTSAASRTRTATAPHVTAREVLVRLNMYEGLDEQLSRW